MLISYLLPMNVITQDSPKSPAHHQLSLTLCTYPSYLPLTMPTLTSASCPYIPTSQSLPISEFLPFMSLNPTCYPIPYHSPTITYVLLPYNTTNDPFYVSLPPYSTSTRTSSTGSTPAGRPPTSTTVWRMGRHLRPVPSAWTRMGKQVGHTDRALENTHIHKHTHCNVPCYETILCVLSWACSLKNIETNFLCWHGFLYV